MGPPYITKAFGTMLFLPWNKRPVVCVHRTLRWFCTICASYLFAAIPQSRECGIAADVTQRTTPNHEVATWAAMETACASRCSRARRLLVNSHPAISVATRRAQATFWRGGAAQPPARRVSTPTPCPEARWRVNFCRTTQDGQQFHQACKWPSVLTSQGAPRADPPPSWSPPTFSWLPAV